MTTFIEDKFPREKCVKCGWVHYHNPRPTVSAIISRDGGTQYSSTNSVTSRQSSDEHRSDRREKIILCQRAAGPFAGKWDLPGGFVEEQESAEEAIRREMAEELGINLSSIRLLGVEGPAYYPFGGQENYNLDIYFLVTTNDEPRAVSASDVSKISWFDPDKLPDMAFETNVKAIKKWQTDQKKNSSALSAAWA